tara:strand:+ start:464 stop:910 length:447 start_codon:yes stop_codon:yes gene_type:complete
MKAKTFENLIRKVVREEIDYALSREIKSLKESLRDELKPIIVEHTEELVEVPEIKKASLREKIMGTQPIRKRAPQHYTQNSSLNTLLNETAMGNTNTESGNAPANINKPFASSAPLSEDVTGLPPEVASAVTRDYSGLMGAILKKKGN